MDSPIRIATSKSARGWTIGLGVVLALVVGSVIVERIANPAGTRFPRDAISMDLALCGLLALSVFLFARALYGLELWDDRFSIGSFGKRAYLCSDFVGFRRSVMSSSKGVFTRYLLVGGPGQRDVTVRLDTNFFSAVDAKRFRDWVSRFPDLESADLDREAAGRHEKRLHPEIAGTPILSRRRAREFAAVLRWAGTLSAVLVLAMLWLRPPPYSTVRTLMSMALCLLLPAAMAFKVWRPEAFQLGRVSGPRLPASLNDPFLLGGAALPLLPALLYFQPVRWTSAIPVGLAVAAVVGYPLLRFGLARVDRSPRALTSTVAILLVYGYGAAITMNGAFDRSQPAVNPGEGVKVVIGRGAFRVPWTVGAFRP